MKDLELQFCWFNKQIGFLDVFSSSDAFECHLTYNVSRFDDKLPDDNGKSCVHIRFNNSSSSEDKIK